MTNFSSKLITLAGVFCSIILFSCHKDDQPYTPPVQTVSQDARTYDGEAVTGYFTLLCRVSETSDGFFPPQVARAYGYVGITAYESVVHGIRSSQSLGGQLNGLTALPLPDENAEYNWAISSNAAMADMIRKMFGKNLRASNLQSIDSMENVTYAKLSDGVSDDVLARSVQYGKAIAGAIYTYSLTDGGNEAYLDPFQLPYSIPPDSFCWTPTGAITTPVSPRWGENRPFLVQNIENTAPEAHIAFSTDTHSEFYNQAMQVYNQVNNNTPEQIETAKYWADDPFNTCTPTGHTFNILTQLLQENGATLEKTSVAYAKLAIAESDAFVACWKGKYKYVLIRPFTYITRYIDPQFRTVIGTPPFPAYTSGHSCEIGAGSKIFADLFTNGSGDYNFTDNSQLRFGFLPRHYSNFFDMAKECAESRFFGGIHYPMDNEKGLICGEAIGDNVNSIIHWPTDLK